MDEGFHAFANANRSSWGDPIDSQNISGFFAGESCWRDDIPYASVECIRRVVSKLRVPVPAFGPIVIHLGEKTIRMDKSGPTWSDEPVYESIELVPLAQRNTFEETTALKRPSGLIPTRQLVEYSDLHLSLPSWNTNDSLGQLASIASAIPGTGNSESTLFLRGDILRKYMADTRSRLVWVILGERQRLGESGMNAGYQQYVQVLLWKGRGIKKLYEKNLREE